MTTADEVAADLATFKGQAATREELITLYSAQSWSSQTAGSTTPTTARTKQFRMSMFPSPFPLRILSVMCVWEYWDQPASATNFWSGSAQIGDGPSGFTTVAKRSTQDTGSSADGPIVSRQAWTFDAAAWSDSAMDTGQILAINWVPTGSPTAFTFPFDAAIRYMPL
jgi:hypothetical protein